ncbi:MAG: hypothetical protein WBA12_09550 [Catalinimonas sp.]
MAFFIAARDLWVPHGRFGPTMVVALLSFAVALGYGLPRRGAFARFTSFEVPFLSNIFGNNALISVRGSAKGSSLTCNSRYLQP